MPATSPPFPPLSRPFSPSPPRETRHTASRPLSALLGGSPSIISTGTSANSSPVNLAGLPATPTALETGYEGLPGIVRGEYFDHRDERRRSSGTGRGGRGIPVVGSPSESSTSSSSPPLGAASILATLAGSIRKKKRRALSFVPPARRLSDPTLLTNAIASVPRPNSPPHTTTVRLANHRSFPASRSASSLILGPPALGTRISSRTTPTSPTHSPASPHSLPRLHQPTVVRHSAGRGVSFVPPPAQVSPTGPLAIHQPGSPRSSMSLGYGYDHSTGSRSRRSLNISSTSSLDLSSGEGPSFGRHDIPTSFGSAEETLSKISLKDERRRSREMLLSPVLSPVLERGATEEPPRAGVKALERSADVVAENEFTRSSAGPSDYFRLGPQVNTATVPSEEPSINRSSLQRREKVVDERKQNPRRAKRGDGPGAEHGISPSQVPGPTILPASATISATPVPEGIVPCAYTGPCSVVEAEEEPVPLVNSGDLSPTPPINEESAISGTTEAVQDVAIGAVEHVRDDEREPEMDSTERVFESNSPPFPPVALAAVSASQMSSGPDAEGAETDSGGTKQAENPLVTEKAEQTEGVIRMNGHRAGETGEFPAVPMISVITVTDETPSTKGGEADTRDAGTREVNGGSDPRVDEATDVEGRIEQGLVGESGYVDGDAEAEVGGKNSTASDDREGSSGNADAHERSAGERGDEERGFEGRDGTIYSEGNGLEDDGKSYPVEKDVQLFQAIDEIDSRESLITIAYREQSSPPAREEVLVRSSAAISAFGETRPLEVTQSQRETQSIGEIQSSETPGQTNSSGETPSSQSLQSSPGQSSEGQESDEATLNEVVTVEITRLPSGKIPGTPPVRTCAQDSETASGVARQHIRFDDTLRDRLPASNVYIVPYKPRNRSSRVALIPHPPSQPSTDFALTFYAALSRPSLPSVPYQTGRRVEVDLAWNDTTGMGWVPKVKWIPNSVTVRFVNGRREALVTGATNLDGRKERQGSLKAVVEQLPIFCRFAVWL